MSHQTHDFTNMELKNSFIVLKAKRLKNLSLHLY
jgi:hypothetical protein